jgi:hypothetical protein
VIFVELAKLKEIRRKPVGEPAKAETWALFFKHASNPRHRKLITKLMEHKEEINVAMSLLYGISKDAREREEFRVRLKNRMSIQTDLKVAKEVGEARGEVRGDRKRDKINKLEFVKKLLAIPLPLETIADCAGLPLDVVKLISALSPEEIDRAIKLVESFPDLSIKEIIFSLGNEGVLKAVEPEVLESYDDLMSYLGLEPEDDDDYDEDGEE